MQRVAVTGIGAVTPLGNTCLESWNSAKAGKTGIGPITRFDPGPLPWRVAGEVKGFDPGACLSAKQQRRLDLFIQYALAASLEAWKDAGFEPPEDGREPARPAGIVLGSSRGGISTLEQAIRASGSRPQGRAHRFSPYLMPSTTIGMAPSYIAQRMGFRGYCLGISNACASGANAIGEAYKMIRSGHKGPLLAGGSDAPISEIAVGGYGSSGMLSKGRDSAASRPYDKERDGFVLSEGACVVVLEALESARGRGARIYAEIAGYSNAADGFDQVKPRKKGQIDCMRAALGDAGLSPDRVDYISTHGTSTVIGDLVESEAVYEVFGSVAAGAAKSMTGHMLGASGALEAAFTILTIYEGIIPPTLNVQEQDKKCRIELVTGATARRVRNAVSNSFGLGGLNAVLVLREL